MTATKPDEIRQHRPQRCAFCGYSIPRGDVTGDSGETFCSERCAASFSADEDPFVGQHGYKQVTTGVGALDTLLPRGMPTNSFVLLAGEEGIRHRGVQTELVWRRLQNGEPAVIVAYVDPPVAILEQFLAFDWNVLPFIEDGRLRIVDCFTNRLREEHQSPDQQVAWNDHLDGFLADAVSRVRDPTDLVAVVTELHGYLESLEMVGSGILVVDSLNELNTQGRELQTEQFLKEIRSHVCKQLFVPLFASTTITADSDFIQNHAYIFDGIVDMRRTEEVVPNVRLRQMSIRKMDGVTYHPDWIAYENMGHRGFCVFDPERELDSVYPNWGTVGGR